MSIIDDDSELDTCRILETTNFDDYELIDIPMKSDKSLHELTGVRMAAASDTPSIHRGWHPVKGVQGNCVQEATHARGFSVFSPRTRTSTYVKKKEKTFLEDQSRKFKARKFYADVPSRHFMKNYTPENFPLYGTLSLLLVYTLLAKFGQSCYMLDTSCFYQVIYTVL